MTVSDRSPYAGELVFTAFSGSHQDAIKKGLDRRNKERTEQPDLAWGVPYLTIDPEDIGRSYEAIIRINSQSGKGGIAYILDREHGFDLPKTMHPQVGKCIYDLADSQSKELDVGEIREAFFENFVNLSKPLQLIEYHLEQSSPAQVVCHARIILNGVEKEISGEGNGPINSFVHALETAGLKDFILTDYRSHAIRGGSDSDSAAYIQLRSSESKMTLWGCGVDPSIEMAGLKSLVSAYNLLHG